MSAQHPPKPTTHPHSLGHGFGDFQCLMKVNGRPYLGIGHTPGEARRNALDAIEERQPILAGFCAYMRSEPIPVERVTAARTMWNRIKSIIKPYEDCNV